MKDKLHIGCGDIYLEDYLNTDHNPKWKVDEILDLDVFPYKFKDNTFKVVYASHILEHVNDFWKTFKELLRITKDGGIIHIRVPHFSCGMGYNDLTHKRFFGWHTFQQILDNYGFKYECTNFKIISRRYNWTTDNHPIMNAIISPLFNIIPKGFYERFCCWIFPVYEIELKLEVIK